MAGLSFRRFATYLHKRAGINVARKCKAVLASANKLLTSKYSQQQNGTSEEKDIEREISISN